MTMKFEEKIVSWLVRSGLELIPKEAGLMYPVAERRRCSAFLSDFVLPSLH
jgi:hypothetical protein